MQRRTVHLLIALAIAAAAFYLIEVRGSAERSRERQMASALFAVEPAEIDEIRLSSGVTLRRSAAGFTMTEPTAAPVDPIETGRLLHGLLAARRLRELELPADSLDAFGLDPPRAWGSVRTRDGRLITVDLGRPTPTENSLYARVRESGSATVVWGSIIRDFERSAEALRERRLLVAGVRQVESIRLEGPHGVVSVARDPTRYWRSREPRPGRASAEAIAVFIELLGEVRAAGFADTVSCFPPAVLEPQTRRASFGLLDESGAQRSVVLTVSGRQRRDGFLLAASSQLPRPVLVEPAVIDLLDVSSDSLQEVRLFRPLPREAIGLELQRGADTLVARRSGADWQIVRPESLPADPIRIRALLRNLDNERIARWAPGVDRRAAGLLDPLARVTLFFDEIPMADGIVVGGPASEEFHYAGFEGEEEVFVVPRRVLDFLTPDVGAFEARYVLQSALGSAETVAIRSAAGAAVRLVRHGAQWRDEDERLGDGEAAALVDRLARLAPLDRFSVSMSEGALGFAEPYLVVEWSGGRAGRLQIGDRLDPQRRFGRLQNRDAVYLFYEPDIDALLPD